MSNNMMRNTALLFVSYLIASLQMGAIAAQSESKELTNAQQSCVILLHGLARTSSSMKQMQAALEEKGYVVANVDYPSRTKPIEELAPLALNTGFALCEAQNALAHFVVTHSLGGILLRQYLNEFPDSIIKKAIMLAPPNQGSEVVDELKDVPGYQWLNGPAGAQLGTDSNSVPLQLGPVPIEVAVIAGSFSINLVLSTYLPDPDDGKVSVASTKVDGMCAHLVVDVSHPYIMKNTEVISEVLHYLQHSRFENPTAHYAPCAASKSERY